MGATRICAPMRSAIPATWEITTARDPSARTQELHETSLENLRGFDLDEIESMDCDDLLAHWKAAAEAFPKLDDRLIDGADLPLDWQPVEDAAVAALPRTPAIQPATQRA